jgi:glycerophosphoryl diester phosphodiesterase
VVENDLPAGEKVKTPLIIAHRGDSVHAPENTLAAFHRALEKGADGVEFDVQLSQDGVPVVIHDYDLKRTGGRPETVDSLTAKQLGKIDVGSWFARKKGTAEDAEFSQQTVPTLVEVLETLKVCRGPIYIELKCRDENYGPLAKAVCDVIRDSQMLGQMIVKSFKLAAIPAVRCALPKVTTAALFAPEITHFLRRKRHIIALAREFGADQISLHRSLATSKLASLAADAEMPVTIWTADNPKWIERCIQRNIGALITNDPGKQLAKRSESDRS